jgi:hypothetical protein
MLLCGKNTSPELLKNLVDEAALDWLKFVLN